jgi:hypothetical protein
MEAEGSQCEPLGSVILEVQSGSVSGVNIRLRELLCSLFPPTKQQKDKMEQLHPMILMNQILPSFTTKYIHGNGSSWVGLAQLKLVLQPPPNIDPGPRSHTNEANDANGRHMRFVPEHSQFKETLINKQPPIWLSISV